METVKQHLRFRGPAGQRLAGRLERPEGPPRAYAIYAHCFTCSKNLKSVNWISQALADAGIATLRFDFAGIGDSEGDFSETNFTTNVADLLSAAEMLRRDYRAPQLLVGHSLGGTAALVAGGQIPECRAVATIAAPSDTAHLSDKLLQMAPELAEADSARVDVMGRVVTIKRQMLEDFRQHALDRHIADLGRALAVFHAPDDPVVSFAHAEHIYQAAREPKSLISLDDADHLLIRDPQRARWVGRMIAAWADGYLADADEVAS